MAKNKSIIVFGIGRRNHLIELIKDECHKRNIDLIGCDASPYAAARSIVDGFYQVPYASDASYLTACESLVRRLTPLMYLTIIDPEVSALGQITTGNPNLTSIYGNTEMKSALLCEDKLNFYKYLKSRNVSVVETSETPVFNIPFIEKDRKGSCGSNFVIHKDNANIAQIEGRIFQPLINGQHYCIDAYFDLFSGELIELCAKEVIEKRNGETYVAKIVNRDQFTDLIQSASNAISFKGIVNFDIWKHQDELIIMEINARIGGNYPMSHMTGCNLVGLLLDQLIGDKCPKKFSLKVGEGDIYSKSFYVNKIITIGS